MSFGIFVTHTLVLPSEHPGLDTGPNGSSIGHGVGYHGQDVLYDTGNDYSLFLLSF